MRIEFSKKAVKVINSMNTQTKQRIKKTILKLPDGDVKKLKNYSSEYRLRVGDYRILFNLGLNTIKINDILPRGEAYKKQGADIMMTTKEQLHTLIDIIDVSEHNFIFHFLMKLVPGDMATPEEITAMKEGMDEIARGEFVRFEDVDWD